MSLQWIETYPALSSVTGLTHGFICRNPKIDVKTDRETAIERLQPHFDECLSSLNINKKHFATGEQVHAADVKICGLDGPSDTHFPSTDGLATACAGQFMGIYVADCGAVFVVDPVNKACAAVHSGKKGSDLAIAVRAIEALQTNFGSDPADLIVQVAPCIRPPDYEIDFAAQIRISCLAAGVPESQFFDCGVSTATNLDRYYSYRIEKAETGRMLAVIGFYE